MDVALNTGIIKKTHRHICAQSFSEVTLAVKLFKGESLQWRQNERDGVSNHQPYDCLLNRHQMETLSALLALCAGKSPVTGEFPSQRPVTRSFDVFCDLRHE